MKIKNISYLGAAFVVAFGLMAGTPSSQAIVGIPEPVTNGTVVNTDSSVLAGTIIPSGSNLAGTAFTDGTTSGLLRSVVLSATGLVGSPLTFAYQITNTTVGAAVRTIDFAEVFGFQGFTTAVDYVVPGNPILNTGTVVTVDAARIPGDSISYGFLPPVGASALTNGTTSRWFFAQTNATNFSLSTADISASSGGIFGVSTFAPVPEPTTALFGAALVGVLAARRRRSAR